MRKDIKLKPEDIIVVTDVGLNEARALSQATRHIVVKIEKGQTLKKVSKETAKNILKAIIKHENNTKKKPSVNPPRRRTIKKV